jgi:hypothetical protein
MIWPFRPLDPMIEGLIFRTDRLRAFSTDQRIRLTDIPRRTFNHSYKLTGREYERARAMFRDNIVSSFMVPDWTAFSRVSVSAGATSIAFDNTNPAIPNGGDAVLFQDEETYEQLTISGSTSSGLTVAAVSNSYPNGLVIPLIECDASEGFQATRTIQPLRDVQVEWNSYSGEDIDEEDSSASLYRGLRVLTECSRLGEGTIPFGLIQPFDVVDNGIARPFYDTTQAQPYQQFGAAWQPRTRAEAYDLRRFFHTIKGRQKAFWIPDMNRGLELAANIALSAATITIKHVGFTDGYGSGDLFIKHTNGNVYTLQVVSSMESGANEVLTLEDPAPAAITIAQVDKLSLMFCVILAADRIEWLHRAATGPKVVVPVEEVPVP